MFVLFKKTKERNLNHKLFCILVFLYIITCLIRVTPRHTRTHNFWVSLWWKTRLLSFIVMFCVKSISQSEVCTTDLMNLMNLMNCGFWRHVCTWRLADRQETTRAVIKWRSNMADKVGVSVAPTYNHAVCTPRWAVDAQVYYFFGY